MKRRIVLFAFIGLSALLVRSAPSDAAEQPAQPDWWQAQREVSDELFWARRDIAEVVGEVTASKPKTGQEAMFKLNVLLRAGMNATAVETVEQLAKLCPDLAEHQISAIYYDACDRYESWAVTQRLAEVFANRARGMCLENRLLKHFLESGWSVEQVDSWLAEMPSGQDGFWIKERMRFNVEHDRAEALVRELSAGVRENPADVHRALTFLDALIHARRRQGQEQNLAWLAEVVKPNSPMQADHLASRLSTLEQWEPASVFYRQAIAVPLSDAEVRDYGSMFQAFVSVEALKAMFAAKVREGLAKCLIQTGQKDEAQKWMVEAANIRDEHKLGMNTLFAGRVQRESGARVMENRISAEEEESKDDPAYWRKRAQYYRGRAEPDKEEEALVKALTLTKPEPLPEHRTKGYMDMRAWALSDYANFLRRNNRGDEAVRLLRKELAEAPAETESAGRAARLLGFDFYHQISVQDDVLWNWLGNRVKWEHEAERLLWRMLEKAERSEIDRYFSRAEKMAKDGDATRSNTLGWIMNRMHFAERSIPLLESAAETADSNDLKDRARFTLFESYLDIRDWRNAERMFPQAHKRLTTTEQIDWYGRIAVAAAASGHNTDAMRIWRIAANADPARSPYLRDLARYGLREELADFYRKLAEKLPLSEAPDKAFKILQQI